MWVLVNSIDDAARSSTPEVRKRLHALKTIVSTMPTRNETEKAVEAVFEARNVELREKMTTLAEKIGRGELNDIEPMRVLEGLSSVVKKLRFDHEEGAYGPDYLFISSASEDNLLRIQSTLLEIQRYVLVPQRKLGEKSLLEFVLYKSCSAKTNLDRNCTHEECDVEAAERKANYLFDAQEIGYEWMKVLITYICQRRASSTAEKHHCLTGSLGSSIDDEMSRSLKSQREEWPKVVNRYRDQRKSCDSTGATTPKLAHVRVH